jgi:ADP-ribose pyrophosphatase YjhB (NUDIX family)
MFDNPRIAVASSCRSYPTTKRVVHGLRVAGLNVHAPDFTYDETTTVVSVETKQALTRRFLNNLPGCDALYVIADEGYVGRSVCLEVGAAHALGIPVWASEPITEVAVDALLEGMFPTTTPVILCVQCVAPRVNSQGESSVLLGLRSGDVGDGLWALPGGHVEPGESPAAAAVRELREKTGLVGEVFRVGSSSIQTMEDQVLVHVPVWFRGLTKDQRPVPADGFSRLHFFPMAAPPQGLFSSTQILLRRLGVPE